MADSLLTGLLAFYRNNGTDRSGNGNTLTAEGSPGTTTGIGGVAGAAASMGDSKGWVITPPIITVYPYTVNVWANSENVGSAGFSPWSQVDITDIYQQLLKIISDPAVEFSTGNGAAGISGGVPDPEVWFMLTATATGSVNGVLTVYLNSVKLAQQSFANTVAFGPEHETYWGKFSGDADFSSQFLGMWGRVLSDGGVSVGQAATAGSEIARLYNSGNGMDPTTEPNIGSGVLIFR